MIKTEKQFLDLINRALSLPKKTPNPKSMYRTRSYRRARKYMDLYRDLSINEKKRIFTGTKDVLKELNKLIQKNIDNTEINVKIVTDNGSFSKKMKIKEVFRRKTI
jgi:hypothetical protein